MVGGWRKVRRFEEGSIKYDIGTAVPYLCISTPNLRTSEPSVGHV